MKNYLNLRVGFYGMIIIFAGTLQLAAQPLGTGTNRLYGLNGEQTAKIRATEGLDEMKGLIQKLEAARREALKAAMDENTTVAAVQAKLEAVAKIQVEIAILRYQKGVKPVLSSVTATQKSQVLEFPGASYNQLFVGKTSGLEFVRGGHFEPNSK